MDFNIKKPSHILALIGLIIAFLIIIIIPLISYFGFFSSIQTVQIEKIPQNIRFIVEIIALLIQILILVIVLFIGVPWLWYLLVNKLSIKEMLNRIKLRFENLDIAFFWAIITVIVGFGIFFTIGIILLFFGFDPIETSNIPDIELIFSLPSIIILVVVQPVGEEIFFRGFLLDKINSLTGKETAILTTGILFGIAHLSYAKIFPAIMTALLGILFGYIVVKTKNLNTAIIAHILFNLTSVTFYVFGQSLNLESLIL